jgi:curved DNA-binding protein CbpA
MKAGMAENITLYDVLGVTAGASADTLRRARDGRVRQLRPGLEAGASSPVVAAAARAREAVEFAGLVLGDPELRLRYDREIGLHRERGLRGSHGFAEGATKDGGDPYGLMRAGVGLLDADLWHSFESLLSWMAPLPASPARRVTVPDLRGLFYRPCQAVATMAGFRLAVVRLTANPMPVEGLVTGQSPAPGAIARRESGLTVQVWHPARDSGAPPGGARTRSE